MALDAGDADCTHGLSKRIHDNMLSGETGAIEGDALKAFAYAISTAVVAEIKANASATLTAGQANARIAATLGGLQKSTAPGTPTDPPGGIVDQLLPVDAISIPIT